MEEFYVLTRTKPLGRVQRLQSTCIFISHSWEEFHLIYLAFLSKRAQLYKNNVQNADRDTLRVKAECLLTILE